MICAVKASNGKFYTGRSGDGWLSTNVIDAFTYTKEEAEVKVAQLNVCNAPLCDLTFKVVRQNWNTGFWE